LLQALVELFCFQRILEADAAKQLRRKVRNTREIERLAGGEGVANLNGAVIV